MYQKEEMKQKRRIGERKYLLVLMMGQEEKHDLDWQREGTKEYMRSRIKNHVTEKQDKRNGRVWDTLSFLSLSLSLSLSLILCPYHWNFLPLFCARGFGSYFSCSPPFFAARQAHEHQETMSGTWKEYTENVSHLNSREQYLEKKGMLSVSIPSSIL